MRSHTRRRARRTGAGSGRSPAHSGARTAPRPPSRTPGTLTPTATCGQIAAAAARAAANRRAGRRRAATQAPAAGSPGSPPARSCSWPPCPRWWASPWRCSSRRGRCSGTRGAPEGAAQSRSGWRRRATRRAGHHAGAGNTGSPWVAQRGGETRLGAYAGLSYLSYISPGGSLGQASVGWCACVVWVDHALVLCVEKTAPPVGNAPFESPSPEAQTAWRAAKR